MPKVQFPAHIVTELDRLSGDFTDAEIISGTHFKKTGFKVLYNHFNTEELISTLFAGLANGYEAELTPEQKIKEYYREAVLDIEALDPEIQNEGQAKVEAIHFVLNTLNINIEGVNVETDL